MAITRAVKNVYIVEKTRGHKLISLLGISEEVKERVIKEDVSSADDWKREARRLEMMGKTEQAEVGKGEEKNRKGTEGTRALGTGTIWVVTQPVIKAVRLLKPG
ncbi:MAG: hypothetical protein PHF97_11250 [Bacteroidales bacterium]|nr:hypothetical protein [Bacteroidales bacterium]